MKKFVFYIPPLVYLAFLIFCVFKGVTASSPYYLIWPLILFLAGYILSKGYIKGAILGLLPSIQWLSTGIGGGNSINQLLPMGLIINEKTIKLDLIFGISGTVFYLASAFILYKNRKKHSERGNNNE